MRQKETHGHRKQTGCQGQGSGEGGLGARGQWAQTTAYREGSPQVPLRSTGDCIQHPVLNHSGKECGKRCAHIDTRTHTHAHTHGHTHAHPRTPTCTHALAHTHTHAHANTRTHAHTHTHAAESVCCKLFSSVQSLSRVRLFATT